jgi:hypothetical protein
MILNAISGEKGGGERSVKEKRGKRKYKWEMRSKRVK